MKARDVFGIIVRTVGLLLMIHSLALLQVFLFVMPSGISGGNISGGGIMVSGFRPGGLVFSFLFEAVLGLALLLGANVVVTLTYSRPPLRPPADSRRPARSARPQRPKRRSVPVDTSAAPDFDSLGEKLGDDFEPRVD